MRRRAFCTLVLSSYIVVINFITQNPMLATCIIIIEEHHYFLLEAIDVYSTIQLGTDYSQVCRSLNTGKSLASVNAQADASQHLR